MPTEIPDLREKLQRQGEPPVYIPARLLSIYVTRLLSQIGVKPDAVTIAWGVSLVGAAVAFSADVYWLTVLGTILIAVYYVLDCVDGELARLSETSSKIGSQLEQVIHWVTQGILIIGITIGASNSSNRWVWITGMLTIVGDYTFHFGYFTIHLGFDRTVNYGILHKLTKLLYRLMPINTNLYMIGGIIDQLFLAMVVWSFVSLCGAAIVFSLYYRTERHIPDLVES